MNWDRAAGLILDGEHFVDALRNRISEAMGERCYSALALQHQLLSQDVAMP